MFLGEAEVNAFANVDDLFFGSLTLALEYDDGETEVELEEAYLQTLALPAGFQATAGKIFSAIGYLNPIHAHADDFADRPLAYRAFLGEQFGDPGVRLTWVAPTDLFVQLGGEAFRGDAFPAGGARNNGVGAHSAFVRLGGDIGPELSWGGGLSWLHAAADGRETGDTPDSYTGDTDLGIAHLVLKWAPAGNPAERNLTVQAEAFVNRIDGRFNDMPIRRTDHGAYGQAVYQFMPRWKAGYRFDWLAAGGTGAAFAGSTLDDRGHDPTRHGVMVQFSNSEFSRIRLQYNYDRSRPDGAGDHQALLQYTATLGAHPAHAY